MIQVLNSFQQIPSQCATIVDILRDRSCNMPQTQAFTFLEDGENQELTLTYHELDRRSRAVATQLQALGLSGERAILLYPPGLDYLIAFLVVYTLESWQFQLIRLVINVKRPEYKLLA